MHHPILANETDDVAEQEIAGSLQALLGRPVDIFAYPNGARGLDFGARERRLLREWGVQIAFATDTEFFNARTAPLAIPRAALSGDESGPRDSGAAGNCASVGPAAHGTGTQRAFGDRSIIALVLQMATSETRG